MHGRAVEQARVLTQQVLEGVVRPERSRGVSDLRHPGPGQRCAEPVRLAGACGECAQSAPQPALGPDAAVPGEVQPGQPHVLAMAEVFRDEVPALERVQQLCVAHSKSYITTSE